MSKQAYYLVECDSAVNPDKSFNLKETEKLTKYIGNLQYLMYDYEIYLCVWDNLKSEFDLKLNLSDNLT
jgi:hypothetical protein